MGVEGKVQDAEISWDAANKWEKARKAQSVVVHSAFHPVYVGKDMLSVEQST